MIARWAGQCSICNGSVAKGVDVHYSEADKTVEHWECWEDPRPSPEQFALADELGYIHVSPDMGSDGFLRRMLPRTGSPAAGRVEPAPSKGQGALWTLPAKPKR